MATVTYNQIPGTLDIKITSGDVWALRLTFTDYTTGDPIDLSIQSFVCKIYNGPDFVMDITVAAITLVDGIIELRLTAAQTDLLDSIYSWYLSFTASGAERKMLSGRCEVI